MALHEPAATRKKRGPAKGTQSPRYTLDISALEVQEGVPCQKKSGPVELKWDALFDKLQKPGQSIELPGHLKSAVSSAAFTRNKRGQARFKCFTTGPDTARVWRTA